MSPVTNLVLNRVQLIAPRIDEAMASAIIQAETRAQGFDQDRFPHIRPLNIRQDVRLSLSRASSRRLAGRGRPTKDGPAAAR